MIHTRTLAILYRIAKLTVALFEEDQPEGSVRDSLERQLEQALKDLDHIDPDWRDNTPLWRSNAERKGR